MIEFDFSTDLKKDLVTQFKNQPNLDALVSVVEKQFTDLCDFLNDLRRKRSVETAEGVQLDRIGDIAVLSRAEAGRLALLSDETYVLSDEDYRQYLIFKIWKNTNNTTYYDVMKAFRMFWKRPLHYREDPEFPATMIFETDPLDPKDPTQDPQKLFRAAFVKAAGVGIHVIANTQYDPFPHDLWVHSLASNGIQYRQIPELPMIEEYEDNIYTIFDRRTIVRIKLPDLTSDDVIEVPTYLVDELYQYLIDERGYELIDEEEEEDLEIYLLDEMMNVLVDEEENDLILAQEDI